MNIKPIALSFELDKKTNGRIQLFPFGRFYSQDGRTEGAGGWYVDDSNGYALAEQINQLKIKLMIDYEHQTLFIETNGKPNPAAGWMEKAEYISGEGIFVDVDWTKKPINKFKTGNIVTFHRCSLVLKTAKSQKC
ncbi:Mu-like prophage I protein [Rodentibacter pneumotropicus]|uniref:Mu-like prophage I protein n=1 Tax=Rodentibacter pneumotropicus TaxID=758 RepID=A0A3S4TY24_9PAST|nr:Mu-like prophage I protein [Rodentibacter pneumotropicus]